MSSAASARSSGRAVPLSLPLESPTLRVLQRLRTKAHDLERRLAVLARLQQQLDDLPDEPRYDAVVPLPCTSSLAYSSSPPGGRIVETNTVTVNLGGGEDSEDGQDSGYWVEYSAKQAKGVARRKAEAILTKLDKLRDAIKEAEATLSAEMGYEGGSLNENYEVLNEEGLPFVEIQEFEEDEGSASSSSPSAPATPAVTNVRAALPPFQQEYKRAPEKPLYMPPFVSTSSLPAISVSQAAPPKKVAFSDPPKPKGSHKAWADDDVDLPVISSAQAAATAPPSSRPPVIARSVPSTSAVSSAAGASPSAIKDQVFERPVKGTIIEKDTTRPPPVLTAAERSTKSGKSKLAEAATFDGVATNNTGKKVDLSAYLPKSLRGKPDKGKGRAVDDEDTLDNANDDEGDEEEEEEEEDDSDSDGFYQYDDSDEDEDDNIHIDDIMAMREAALEYHARRYDLAAGAGTGPLGGYGKADDFDEPGLTEADKGGLPFVETYMTEEDAKRPSKFRAGRLQNARMIIPELQPGDPNHDLDIASNVVPGDSLGPLEGVPGATEDFKGMSKEEIETFLQYVKALETGQSLDDIAIVPAQRAEEAGLEEAPVQSPQERLVDAGPRPPAIKETIRTPQPPSVKTSIVERSEGISLTAPPAPSAASPPSAAPPKRVSRFRAARE